MAGPVRAITDFLGLTSDWRPNDAALRNMNPNAFYYGGEGRDTFVNEVNNAARFADEAARREMNVDASGYNADRIRDTLASQQQSAGLGMLYRTATGKGGPSIAQMQAGNQMAQAAANMRAQAASARGGGGNAAAAMRTAIRQGGAAGVAAANQGGILRAQEQLAAQNAYMQGASQMRGQEQNRMGQSANWAFGNTAAQQANRNANDAARQFFEAQRQGMFQGNQQAQQAGQQYRANALDSLNRINAQMEGAGPLQAMQSLGGLVAGGVGTIGSPAPPQPPQQGGYAPQPGTAGYQSNYGGQNNPYGPRSDERLKENVSNGGPAIRSALDSLDPKSFRYKDQGLGEGQRLGIMAQDMERTPYGKAIVEEDEGGKVIDANGGLNMALAAIADLHKRLKKFEGEK